MLKLNYFYVFKLCKTSVSLKIQFFYNYNSKKEKSERSQLWSMD